MKHKRALSAPSFSESSGLKQSHKSRHDNRSRNSKTSSSVKSEVSTGSLSQSIDKQSVVVSRRSFLSSRPRSSRSRSVTTATSATSQSVSNKSQIVSIAEGRGVANEIGIAIFDMVSSEMSVYQFADTQTFGKTMQILIISDPLELLLTDHGHDVNVGKFRLFLEKQSPDFDLISVDRKHFDDAKGFEYLSEYGISDTCTSMLSFLPQNYYGLSALSALFVYLETYREIRFHRNSLKFSFRTCDGTMLIGICNGELVSTLTDSADSSTVANLELIRSLREENPKLSLLGVINMSKTKMGYRLLRANLLQPLTDPEAISLRQKSANELIENQRDFKEIRKNLEKLPDIDYLISAFVRVNKVVHERVIEQCLGDFLSLRKLLKDIKNISTITLDYKTSILRGIHEALAEESFDEVLQLLEDILSPDISDVSQSPIGIRNQKLFAVKTGYNGLLDVARKTYEEVTEDVNELVRDYVEKYDIPMRLVYSPKSNSYFMTCSTDDVAETLLPLEFVNVTRKKKTLNFSSLDVLKLNERLQESFSEILLMSEQAMVDLRDEIRLRMASLYKLSEAIGLIDMLCSFGEYSSLARACTPEFTDTLAIRKGRHPIKNITLGNMLIPNETYAYDDCNFQIITGPNLSGKSTYLKQVALLCILAQTGCFIPAEYASIRIFDQVFSRIGNDDKPEVEASSFTVEMREVSYILKHQSAKSLIIIDELGRGTSNFDGLSITCAICEELIKSKAFTFLTTHFLELSEILEYYPNVSNLHLRVRIPSQGSPLKFFYRIESGKTDSFHYGLHLARSIPMPDEVLEVAERVSRDLSLKWQDRDAETRNKLAKTKRDFKCVANLIQIHENSNLDGEELLEYVRSIQKTFLAESRNADATGKA